MGSSSNMEHMMKKIDHVAIDVNKLAESLKADLGILPAFSESCCIYKVRDRLLELNKDAYTPRMVSIGPIHHGKEKLKAMEEHKRMYLREFLQLTEISMEAYVKLVTDNETRLRNCYAETIELKSEDFVKMILMDAAFVIMILLKSFTIIKTKSGDNVNIDRIFYAPWKIREIRYDLILLENQLPFFIFDRLHGLSNGINVRMTELTHNFMESTWVSEWPTENISKEVSSSEIEHFIDFLRIYQEPSEELQRKKLKTLSAPSVKELQQAGVKFELSSSKKLLEIKFDKNKGKLEFPRLKLEDNTEILFRNLQAFEQCHSRYNYLNDYISLMVLLVKSAKDAEILVQNEIINSYLSSAEAVSILFYILQKQNSVDLDDFLFADLIEDLDRYCKRRRNRWKANLKENYFNTPWTAISVFAAAFLLILTVLQSVCSIIQVLPK